MDKTAIKNFAVRARNKLIEDITQKVYELGITKSEIKEIETFEGGFKVKGLNNGKTYKKYEIKQRDKLISNIIDKGYEQVIEEVAYTWFNRFIALRFMEVNEYLPTGVRVLSSKEVGKTEPDIIKEALNVDLDIDKDIVYRLIDEHDTDDLYKYLLIRQCNELGKIMPMVFEEIADYTELLLPDNLLSENSVIRDLVESVNEEDYKDQVEIIGWMYQYYISEKKDEVFADLKKNKKITKENIPAATQLFTPKWIVKYMVENSLGRLWLESHLDEDLKAQWKYYLEEAEQEPEVQKKLDELKNPNLKPEDIKVLDPACGSGHILVYAFAVLYDIYLKANYSERDIPQLILEKNLYGLDIDDRAGQLASFALMMKARSKNKRIFRKKIYLNVCSIQESNGITKEAIDYLVGDNEDLRKDVEYLIDVFEDSKEYGAILSVKNIDFNLIERRLDEIKNEDTKVFDLDNKDVILEKIPILIKQGKIMAKKYEVVCTNPPYMGNGGMGIALSSYVKKYYQNSSSDLFSVFMEVCKHLTTNKGYMSMITQHSWMFLSSFEKLRYKLLNIDIINMAHLGARAFEEIGGEVVQTTAFVLRNVKIYSYKAKYIRLIDLKSQSEKEKSFLMGKNIYITNELNFICIPGKPIAYWISEKVIEAYEKGTPLGNLASPRKGNSTSNNNRFLRLWYEVDYNKENFKCNEIIKEDTIEKRWFPYNKGGGFRKWYGNNEYMIDWKNDAEEIRNVKTAVIANYQYFMKPGLTWSTVSSVNFSIRKFGNGFIFDNGGCCIFDLGNKTEYILGLLNSNIFKYIFGQLNPTLNFQSGEVAKFPVVYNENFTNKIREYVNQNVTISHYDWDNFETSWEFKEHPFLNKNFNPMYLDLVTGLPNKTIESAFVVWKLFSGQQFIKLKSNEEELNKIFIEIYGLQDELSPEVEDNDVTIRKADRERDIKSFISYAVGCMFGRYSLDEDGLIYAGGEFDISRYKKFIPTTDNVLIIADDDYFEDDVVNRFVEFIKVTFGEETLEENLDYIAETLVVKTGETSRQAIRRYFLKDFYNDHVKTYKKRPIYWQFDSGKQNGFKALIYMHRYDSSTVARVRIDYLHKLQRKYEAEVNRLELMFESDLSTRDAAAARKKIDSIKKQIKECLDFDQVIAHVANQKIEIDLDDGVKVNYAKFQDIEVPQGEGKKPIKANLLPKI